MATLDDDKRTSLDGVTRTRCSQCKRFAKLAPGDRECASCAGRLPLELPAPSTTGVRGGR
jgi:hypothetical protein